ncbi:RNA polymerase sigma factor [Spirosoma gilvum]
MRPIAFNEAQLVCDLQAGHSSAFTTLYDAYSPALFGVLLRMVKDQQQAEDLLQDAFIKIWTNIQRYDPKQARLFTWLLTVTRNVALDTIRSRKLQATLETYMYEGRTDDMASTSETMPHQSVLTVLSPKYSQILELTYQGYTKEEIATTFNLPLGTVKTRFRTAIQLLKGIFRQDIHLYNLS